MRGESDNHYFAPPNKGAARALDKKCLLMAFPPDIPTGPNSKLFNRVISHNALYQNR